MATFELAYEKMIKNEGGYLLHRVSGDSGGQTYAGIARNYHPSWKGWQIIDRDDLDNASLTELVKEFYKENFWDRIKGDEIESEGIAESIFDFAVNAGVRTAAKLAQIVVDSTPDGRIGTRTLTKLNNVTEEIFVLKFALAKVTRYAEICNKKPTQKKFLLGWINRTIGGLA